MKKIKTEYVEVVDTKILSEENLDTLVRFDFRELLNIKLEQLLQRITVLAIGKDDDGQFKIENLNIKLAGIVSNDIIFSVSGIIKKYEVQKKKLPKIPTNKKVIKKKAKKK